MAREIVLKVSKTIAVIFLFVCAFCTTTKTYAYSVYEGTVSTTYTTYFTQILNKEYNSDYVVFRSGQYTYTMLTGNIELNGSIFSGSNLKEYTFTTSSSYNSYTQFSTQENQSLNMNASNYIVYSNLGDYPTLVEKGDNIQYATSIIFCVFMLIYVLQFIFNTIF